MVKQSTGHHQQVVVVGGGVVGCFLAYRLSLAGVRVTLLEREAPGAGASGASAGNVQPVTGAENIPFQASLGAESLALYRQFLPAINEESGKDLREQDVRYLYAATTAEEEQDIRELARQMQAAGLRVAWIDAASANELDPRLSREITGGMLHEDCIQMDPQRFVSALALAAQVHSARLVVGEAMGLEQAGGRLTGLKLSDGSALGCDAVVLAMGAWTGQALQAWLGWTLPIEPCGLQKLHLRTDGPPLGCAVRWGGVNVVQRRDGLIHAGSRRDPAGFAATPEPASEEWLLSV